jgi:hypothetical protein
MNKQQILEQIEKLKESIENNRDRSDNTLDRIKLITELLGEQDRIPDGTLCEFTGVSNTYVGYSLQSNSGGYTLCHAINNYDGKVRDTAGYYPAGIVKPITPKKLGIEIEVTAIDVFFRKDGVSFDVIRESHSEPEPYRAWAGLIGVGNKIEI